MLGVSDLDRTQLIGALLITAVFMLPMLLVLLVTRRYQRGATRPGVDLRVQGRTSLFERPRLALFFRS